MFLGDLNVLEPDHQPRYRFFQPFEYEYDFYRNLTDRHGLVDAFRSVERLEELLGEGKQVLRQPDIDDEPTAPLYRPHHRPEPTLALHVDIPTGCPIDVEINSYGEVGISLGTTTTVLHLNFEPPALRQLLEQARRALGPT